MGLFRNVKVIKGFYKLFNFHNEWYKQLSFFQDVGTQAVVTEYLVRYVDLIFNDKIPTLSHSSNGVEGTPKKSRPKSLAISTPTKLISIEEARSRALSTAIKPDQKYIEVGEYLLLKRY